ncbi:helix-turn-helix domain-containing protein [Erwinia aphidicola]|uniref:helix-turn-helix domain-containing protein n=1 Tax=Erwinia aphidicola TaxID=68334 RepID=UPI00300C7582
MANRYARDTFPADCVIICHLQTGTSLIWLSTGVGSKFVDGRDDKTVHLKRIDITNGKITTQNDLIADISIIPEGLSSPFMLTVDKTTYLADRYDGELVDGFWFIEIDGIVSVRELYRFPSGRVRIEKWQSLFRMPDRSNQNPRQNYQSYSESLIYGCIKTTKWKVAGSSFPER